MWSETHTPAFPPAVRTNLGQEKHAIYRTCYLALGLLETLYSQAQVRMLAGNRDLTNHFVTAWLLQFVPTLGNEIAQLPDRHARPRYASPWHERLKPLITGSEEFTPESLDWRPLGPGSPAGQALAGLASLEAILAAPSWAASLACSYAIRRQQGEIDAAGTTATVGETLLRDDPLKIEPAERLFRTPQQALGRVTEFWLQALPYLIHLPLSESQRRFVLRWKKNQKPSLT